MKIFGYKNIWHWPCRSFYPCILHAAFNSSLWLCTWSFESLIVCCNEISRVSNHGKEERKGKLVFLRCLQVLFTIVHHVLHKKSQRFFSVFEMLKWCWLFFCSSFFLSGTGPLPSPSPPVIFFGVHNRSQQVTAILNSSQQFTTVHHSSQQFTT